jgi:hypothetical protein
MFEDSISENRIILNIPKNSLFSNFRTLKKNYFFSFENFNISINNIISVKAAKVLGYHMFAFATTKTCIILSTKLYATCQTWGFRRHQAGTLLEPLPVNPDLRM